MGTGPSSESLYRKSPQMTARLRPDARERQMNKIVAVGLAALALAGCNTMEGLGRDLTLLGDNLTTSSREAQGKPVGAPVDSHDDLDGAPGARSQPAAPPATPATPPQR
jgi:predicted small secreted protein